MNNKYTVLAFIRNEPLRIKSIIENFKDHANIIALLDASDTTTKSVLIDNSIEYRMRPENYMDLEEARKTEWILNQSPTDYVFICFASFYVPLSLLKIFGEVSCEGTYDAIKLTSVYWSYGSLVQQPTIFNRSDSCYFFNRKKVRLDKVCIHNEYIIDENAKQLVLSPERECAINVMRDDDMAVVVQKHVGYAEREALQLLEKAPRVKFSTIIHKTLRAFVNNYIRMGGFRAGVPGLIYHTHYAIYQFLVYSHLWELQNEKTFSKNRIAHQSLRLGWIKNDKAQVIDGIKEKD